MSIKERIDSAVVESEKINNVSFMEAIPTWTYVAIALSLVVTICICIGIYISNSYSIVADISGAIGVFVILSWVIFAAGIFSTALSGMDRQEMVRDIYQENIEQNFNLTSDDLQELELKEFKDSKRIQEATFYYDDEESKTRYDMVIKFDKETYEPSIMKTATVTDAVIEKISK